MKMGCLKSRNPLFIFLFPLFLVIFPTKFHPSNAAARDDQVPYLQNVRIPEVLDVSKNFHGIVEQCTRRIAEEIKTNENTTYMILAAERTHRKDPTDNFNYYTGGWDLFNHHYISSVLFSAAGPIIAGLMWFLVFGISMFCLCICCCCLRRKSYGYSRTTYALSMICLTLFTISAVAGVLCLHAGQIKFQDSIVDIVGFILHKADVIISNLKDLLDNLLAAKYLGVGKSMLPKEIQDHIDIVQTTINTVSASFRQVTKMSSLEIRRFLSPLTLTTIVSSIALLLVVFLGYLSSIFGLQCVVYILLVFGWILVTLAFVMSGMFLLVHNIVADSCVAMGEWLNSPAAHSTLEGIIPKVDLPIAEDIASAAKGVTLGLISIINVQISNVSNVNMPPNAGPLYYNQSGPLVPLLCSPYNTDLTDRNCTDGEVGFDNAPQAWKDYVCEMSDSGHCATTGRITPDGYDQMVSAENVSRALYTQMEFVADLMDSTYFKQLFGEIHAEYCHKLDRYTNWMYSGFLTCAVSVMLAVILWIVYTRERNDRKYTRKIDANAKRYVAPSVGYGQASGTGLPRILTVT